MACRAYFANEPLRRSRDKMKDLVLELVTSYENGISMAEALIANAYDVTAGFDQEWEEIGEKRERLKISLQEILARNCSLRRKDFNRHINRVLADSERKRDEIEEEQKHVREVLKEYLDEQKALVASLKEKLVGFSLGEVDRSLLESLAGELRMAYQDKSDRIVGLLQGFQQRLKGFQAEQEEINHRLRRLVERGDGLRLEDLRQLDAAYAREERKVERELRRLEVERLLARFGQQRREDGRHGRQ